MLKPCAIVELIWQDASGSRSATTMFAPSSLAVATIDADASALASILVSLTGCTLVAQRIKYVSVSEDRVAPNGLGLISHAGMLFFAIDGSASGGSIVVPAIVDTAFVADGPGAGAVLDLENEDVSSLITATLDSGICNPFGVPFLDCTGGYLQSRL